MPTYNHFTFQQGPGGIPRPSAQAMAKVGPVLRVQIEVPNALAQTLQAAQQAIPTPVDGYALVDTGASITSVDVTVFARLGINPVGLAHVGTAGGPQQQSTYPVRFTFPGTNLPGFEHTRSLGCNLAGQMVIGGEPLIALVGRDVLARFILIYNGTAGMWSLTT